MQFSLLTAAFFAVAAMANPLEVRNGAPAAAACAGNGLFSVAQCCTNIVLGVAALDCVTPPTGTTVDTFVGNCILDAGREAGCCVAPLLGQALLCQPAPLN
ncbi:cerato-ulmin [Roridomyces roridus]|uniref:Cerato-ulmin n=1 Tax=Roridomyces roridus TaxID=1738132 RepID=A0AAD7FF70_9AGAR|nr:cerato-ulmin [Roridomyces roridus]